jgi:hypothetical protein
MARHLGYVDIVACFRMERQILQLLLHPSDDWPLPPVEQVMDTTDEPIIALDAMAGLCDVGLLQRRGDHIMVTKAALAFHQMTTWP